MDFSPTASCFLMIASISRSSTAFNCSAVISFFSRLARASFSADERKQAADMVGAERRLGTLHCDYFLFIPLSSFNFARSSAWLTMNDLRSPRSRLNGA